MSCSKSMDANVRAVATYKSISTVSALKEVTDCWRNKKYIQTTCTNNFSSYRRNHVSY